MGGRHTKTALILNRFWVKPVTWLEESEDFSIPKRVTSVSRISSLLSVRTLLVNTLPVNISHSSPVSHLASQLFTVDMHRVRTSTSLWSQSLVIVVKHKSGFISHNSKMKVKSGLYSLLIPSSDRDYWLPHYQCCFVLYIYHVLRWFHGLTSSTPFYYNKYDFTRSCSHCLHDPPFHILLS